MAVVARAAVVDRVGYTTAKRAISSYQSLLDTAKTSTREAVGLAADGLRGKQRLSATGFRRR